MKKKNLNLNENQQNDILKINYHENLDNYNQRLKEFAIRQTNFKNKNSKKSNLVTNLQLQIANPRLSGPDAAPRLDFDVLVSSNVNTSYFDAALIRIIYNTSAFGSNAVANGNLIVTRAASYNSSTYTNPQADAIDQTSNVIGIPFGTVFPPVPYNRVLVTTTPKIILTLSIKIQSCGQVAGLNFTDIAFTSIFSYFTLAANSTIGVANPYDNTTYSGNILDNTCTPIITSFNDSVPAGVNKVLTITGKYFGSSKGNGTVIFKNADKGTTYPSLGGPYNGGVQQYDVLKWKNDTIKIRMPGTIDSVNVVGGRSVPGSGKFQVVNRYGKAKESSSKLTISYAVTQYPDGQLVPPYRKIGLTLASQNSNGYKIQVNPHLLTPTFPNIKSTIKKAMKDWSCATGINWFLGNDTTLGKADDKFCVIDTGVIGTALMKTDPSIRSCVVGGVNVFYLRSFDIRIKEFPSAGIWKTDTIGNIGSGEYDFYSAISHEFGHGHGVSHINDSINDLMWFAGYSTGYLFPQRKLVIGSPMARTAGDYIADSLIGNLNCVGNHVTVIPQNCSAFIGIKKVNGNYFNVIVGPNPSLLEQEVRIKFELEKESGVSFELFDITGKQILKTAIEKLKIVDQALKTENIKQGIYLLQINVDNQKQTYKIVKH